MSSPSSNSNRETAGPPDSAGALPAFDAAKPLEAGDNDAVVFDPEFPVEDPSCEPDADLPQDRLRVAASGFEAVTEETFNKIGVRDNETRVLTIRNAAKRTANRLLTAHRSGSIGDLADPLTDLAWTTYRLIDPRYRLDPFQQVRVGRILPMALTQAAVLDLVTLDLTGENPDPPNPMADPVLFGHRLPVVVEPPTETKSPTVANTRPQSSVAQSNGTRPNMPHVIESPARSEHVDRPATLDDSRPVRSEALEAFTELRSQSLRFAWPNLLQDKRVFFGTVAVSSAAVAMLLVFAIRRSMTPDRVIAQRTSHQESPLGKAATSGPRLEPDVDSLPATLPSPVTPSGVTPSAETPDSAMDPEPAIHSEPAIHPSEANPSSETAETESVQGVKVPSSKPLFVGPPIDAVLLKVERPEPKQDDSAKAMDIAAPGLRPAPPLQKPAEMPAEMPIAATVLDPDEVEAAIDELWTRTPSAARRFTLTRATELIDHWDFDAELAGFGTVEHAAARALALRAAWLVEPFSRLVDRIQEQGPIRDWGHGSSADTAEVTNDLPCCHLNAGELRTLLQSWIDTRARVVITSDLDQLLHQSNVLLDRILVTDQISASERSDLIAKLTVEGERLARIARDKTVIAESSQLAVALESFPDSDELDRLESSDDASGFLGRVRCLKQRQWDVGLESLARTSDPAIAGCAKAELELTGSQDASREDWIELAARWSKIAVRLPEREAAAVRLHAITLYGDSEDYARKRVDLESTLPSYLASLVEL